MTAFVYGAGRMGREVLAHCRADGMEPSAFIDRCARPGLMIDGLRVISPDAATGELHGADLLLALHSPGVDVPAVVDALHVPKSANVRTLWDECRRSGWLPRSPFWLDPGFDWSDEAMAALGEARALLADDASRAVFDQQVALRRFGDYRGLAAPTPADQYMPRGLGRWRQPMRLLDCGAYDGDTIRALRADGYTIEKYVALEPDADNHARLVAQHGDDAAGILMRVGAHSTGGRLAFSGEGSAARVDADGATSIEVMRIDDLCRDFHPTLIKMDIEGAERQALEGANTTIVRDYPSLAISVYHRIDDLWRIPLQIHALMSGYRFHLRGHAHCGFETVLYALAP